MSEWKRPNCEIALARPFRQHDDCYENSICRWVGGGFRADHRRHRGNPDRLAARSAPPAGNAVTGGVTSGSTPAIVSDKTEAGPVRTKSRPEMKPATHTKPAGSEDESLAKSVRKMWDNPAGKSMMNQGVKIAVAMMYQDFIDGMDLTQGGGGLLQDPSRQGDVRATGGGNEDDERHAGGAEGAGGGDEQPQQGRTMRRSRSSSTATRISRSSPTTRTACPNASNSTASARPCGSKGAPLDADTEARLVEAMHRARIGVEGAGFLGSGGDRGTGEGQHGGALREYLGSPSRMPCAPRPPISSAQPSRRRFRNTRSSSRKCSSWDSRWPGK